MPILEEGNLPIDVASLEDALHNAVSTGEVLKLELLLSQWSLNHPPSTPPPLQDLLNLATREAQLPIITYLLKHGASIQPSTIGSAVSSNSTAVLETLKAEGNYDINMTAGHPGDALIMAVAADKIPLVRWLLAHGADPNLNRLGDTYTALGIAAMHGSPESVALLLQHDADMSSSNALKIAAFYNRVDMLECLLDAGADPNQILDDEYTNEAERVQGLGGPLHEAAAAGQQEAVEVLLRRGADSGLRDSVGKTALMRAEAAGKTEVVEAMRAAGVKE